ncbi:hypothetical protein D3273_15655 [Lichenibacterium minor]|uniref:Uncharacterized protein n=1 Tax=Lichenibacterium minor TaxID=2316528 RepID=A0A4Q2U7Z3_9HYPH|nr:hypothetical protein [Lichenibacterium minor]RYC30975.1 hypothetical protein D3273_15655 [Lichenibacterium minor]
MRRSALGIIAACALAGLGLGSAEAQTPGGQTGGTSGGTGGASSSGGQGDAGGTGHTGVKTEGSGRPAPAEPAAGSSAGGVSGTPIVGSGANGNGGVMTGTTGKAPP